MFVIQLRCKADDPRVKDFNSRDIIKAMAEQVCKLMDDSYDI